MSITVSLLAVLNSYPVRLLSQQMVYPFQASETGTPSQYE